MIVNFNLERLDSLLSDFYKITGLTISIWDSELNQLNYYPKEMCSFCRLIRTKKIGAFRCLESDRRVLRKAQETKQPQTLPCHARLLDTAVPIMFKDTILGFLMFGQAVHGSLPIDFIKKLGKELKLDSNQLIENSKTLKQYQPDTIQSAANILKMATRYLWLYDMIKIDQDDLLEKIQEYVRENASESITIDELCEKFYISRNKLYALVEKRLHCTIGGFVRKIRIDKAKALLVSTDLNIVEIANSVGFAEYNYFIKIFKSEVGTSPLQYRKQFLS